MSGGASGFTEAGAPRPGQLPVPGLPPNRLVPLLEAVLFAATEPVPVRRLAEIAGVSEGQVEAALAELRGRLEEPAHGVELLRVAGGYRLFTKKAYAPYIEALLQPERTQLSPAALETLAIIAYKQPITRGEIEAIRGVQCDHTIKTLLDRQLIREAGRRDGPGRPILYATTPLFLERFGLSDLKELPPPESFLARDGGAG